MKMPLPIAYCRFPAGGPPPRAAGPAEASGTKRRAPGAFTLVEILVGVALLSFIVLGLFAMFNQTQRAFRLGMTQADILEAGRAVTELVPSELEQAVPSSRAAFNFAVTMISDSAPLTQSLPGTAVKRTNLLQDCFMLLRQNQNWLGIGYCVRTNDETGHLWLPEVSPRQLGVGTLYRFAATLPVLYTSSNASDPRNGLPQDPNTLYVAFRNACVPGSPASLLISNRICDGVVHFRLRCYATNGFPLFSDGQTNLACFCTNALAPYAPYRAVVQQTGVTWNPNYPDSLAGLYFWSNAVPAAVDLELGLLEQYAWERYNSIGSAAARLAYLQRDDTSSRVHIFRQRIPIRNVDPLPYQ